jgi:hypothetical protein
MEMKETKEATPANTGNTNTKGKPSNKKLIWIIVAVVVVFLCIGVCALVLVLSSLIPNIVIPTPTPSVTVTDIPVVSNINGEWLGSYTITGPAGCAGYTGSWDATLFEQNGILSGSYSSDAGLGGEVSGTVSGSDVNWSVGGSGGVSFTGTLNNGEVSGNFTGPICSSRYNSHTTGTFTGGKRLN